MNCARAGKSGRMSSLKQPAVYLLASQRNGTLYVGVTSNLIQRIWQHRQDQAKGFSERYQVHRLVWFERHEEMAQAILREKQIKKWQRSWKLELIERVNPRWDDLWEQILG